MLEYIYRNFVIASLVLIILILLGFSYLFYKKHFENANQIVTNDDYFIKNKPRSNFNYMDGLDIIYWINLDRSNDRRKKMTQLFQDPVFQNIQIQRVTAVDGIIPKQVYPKLNLMNKQKNDYEYACMLSHLETIRSFSNTDLKIALIMEDDVTLEFKKYWRKSVREIIDNAPPDWEIIQLCYITVDNNPETFKLYEPNYRNKCVSAAAYLIKNGAARKLMNGIYSNGKYNLEHYIIHHADCYLFTKLKTYTYKYPLFIYKTNNDSLLHPEDLMEHEYSKMKIENMYNQLVIE
jgi:hypothetical protein